MIYLSPVLRAGCKIAFSIVPSSIFYKTFYLYALNLMLIDYLYLYLSYIEKIY